MARAGRSRCFVDLSGSVSEAIGSDEINRRRYLSHAGTFHYSCGDFVDCAADKDVGGYKGSIFLGVCKKQSMKLGQRERVCVVEIVLGGEGLGLMASFSSPASPDRALLNVLLNLFRSASPFGNWDCHRLSLGVGTVK